jgi:D-lyxose ketol-isomerase
MLTRKQVLEAQRRALMYMERAGVVLSETEKAKIEVSDFGLSDLEHQGAQILTFFNTNRLSAKVIVLFPWQILPEHWHPAMGRDVGKEEIMRVRWGEVYLYVPGPPTPKPKAKIPAGEEINFTVWHEVVLRPGDQHIIPPQTVHWFQAGDEGAVIDDYSSTARDLLDGFTNPRVVRETRIIEDEEAETACSKITQKGRDSDEEIHQ